MQPRMEDDMKNNMGTADRIVRFVAALLVAVFYSLNLITGTAALVLGAFALVFVATAFLRFCPLYLPFNISTAPKDK